MSFVGLKGVKNVVKAYSQKVVQQKPQKLAKKGRGHYEAQYSNGNKVHVKYADEPFNRFAQIFQHLDYSCKGSSINKEKLDQAIENGCKMVVVGYEDGRMYQYPAKQYREWSKEHDTTRETKYQATREETYSIPLDIMQKLQ